MHSCFMLLSQSQQLRRNPKDVPKDLPKELPRDAVEEEEACSWKPLLGFCLNDFGYKTIQDVNIADIFPLWFFSGMSKKYNARGPALAKCCGWNASALFGRRLSLLLSSASQK